MQEAGRTGDDERAEESPVEARGSEDEELGRKVTKGDEVREECHVVYAANKKDTVGSEQELVTGNTYVLS